MKISKQLAKAFEDIEYNSSRDQLYDLSFIASQANGGWEACKTVMTFVQSVGRVKYFELLVNGYDVEITPEDNVRYYYEFLTQETDSATRSEDQRKEFKQERRGLENTLALLGVRIEGVNV